MESNAPTPLEPESPVKDGATPPTAAAEAAPEANPEVELLREQLLRATADLQNLRRRVERDTEDRARRKSEVLLRAILAGLDELDRALEQIPLERRESDAFVRGVVMIREILLEAVRREGVKEIPTVGLPFDPNLHEAITSAPAPDVPAGHIASEHRKGYWWGDRVLRPSQVVVAAPTTPPDGEAGNP